MVIATESSTTLVPTEEEITAMDKLMSDGKRNFLCKQPQIALDCFVELCEKLSKIYGQESEKCTEAYLYYGKTLLEIARIENGVLGHAVKETPIFGTETEVETEPEEEGEKEVNTEDEEDAAPVSMDEIKHQVVLAMRENVYNESTDDDQTEEEGDEVEEEVPVDESGEAEQKESDQSNVKDEASTSEKDKETVESTTDSKEDGMEVDEGIDTTEAAASDDETDDVSNMELAWEMLELTTVICRRQLKEKDAELKEKEAEVKAVKYTLAESKHCLAQISLEAERYEDAVNDFKECLSIYEEVLDDKHDRLIAEGHYNIALALSFDKEYAEAIKEFEVTVTLLQARVEDLKSKVKGSEGKDEGSLKQWQKEIDQLNDLILLDMKSKIEDALESKKVLDESMKVVRNAASEMFSSGTIKGGFDKGFDAKTEGQKEIVHDCSDKIRSVKRTSDDDTANTEKKLKQASENESEMTEAAEPAS